jgi:hypothetical protein
MSLKEEHLGGIQWKFDFGWHFVLGGILLWVAFCFSLGDREEMAKRSP